MSKDDKPKMSSGFGQKEIDKAAEQLDNFEEQVKNVTMDRMAQAPRADTAPPEITQKAAKADAPYIRPTRSINSKEKFNERFRAEHTHMWAYVKCIVENKEIKGEKVEFWTKKFPGDPAHFWQVPVGRPIYLPRLCAEKLASCSYHILSMGDPNTPDNMSRGGYAGADSFGHYQGQIAVDSTVQRIDCRPVGFGF